MSTSYLWGRFVDGTIDPMVGRFLREHLGSHTQGEFTLDRTLIAFLRGAMAASIDPGLRDGLGKIIEAITEHGMIEIVETY